jgi:bacterioferritin-associated ferredoxin
MYICNCGAVDQRRIRKAIANGTVKFKAMCQNLGVCQQCGICGECAKEFFDSELKIMQADTEAYIKLWKEDPPANGTRYPRFV